MVRAEIDGVRRRPWQQNYHIIDVGQTHQLDRLPEPLLQHDVACRSRFETLLWQDHDIADDHSGLGRAVFPAELIDLGKGPQQETFPYGETPGAEAFPNEELPGFLPHDQSRQAQHVEEEDAAPREFP